MDIRSEIEEARALIAKVELAARRAPAGAKLAERAASMRQLIHDTPDPHNVVRALETVDELLDELRKLGSTEERPLRQAAQALRQQSFAVWLVRPANDRSSGATMLMAMAMAMGSRGGFGRSSREVKIELEPRTDPEGRKVALGVLDQLKREFERGPRFVPVRKGHYVRTKAVGTWFDHYDQVENVVNELMGHAKPSRWSSEGPSQEQVDAFERIRAATELALEMGSAWAGPLVRCASVAAHELRIGTGSGKHGEPRMRAKLVVGRLNGLLARQRIGDAIELAGLNIEFASFARGQVLEESRDQRKALERLCEAWADVDHPMTRDVVARAWLGLGDHVASRTLLESARVCVLTDDSYPGVVREIYLCRLARTAAKIDRELALAWCNEVEPSPIALATHLAVLELDGALPAQRLASELDTVERSAGALGCMHEPASPIAQALQALPQAKGYPDMPGEVWSEVVRDQREMVSEAIARLRSQVGFRG